MILIVDMIAICNLYKKRPAKSYSFLVMDDTPAPYRPSSSRKNLSEII